MNKKVRIAVVIAIIWAVFIYTVSVGSMNSEELGIAVFPLVLVLGYWFISAAKD